ARGVSPQIEDMLGISAEDWAANPCLWLDRMHPADRERVLDRVSRDWESDDPVAIEYRILDRDGAVRWVRERVTLLRDQDGRPCLIQGAVLAGPVAAAEPVAGEGATAVYGRCSGTTGTWCTPIPSETTPATDRSPLC